MHFSRIRAGLLPPFTSCLLCIFGQYGLKYGNGLFLWEFPSTFSFHPFCRTLLESRHLWHHFAWFHYWHSSWTVWVFFLFETHRSKLLWSVSMTECNMASQVKTDWWTSLSEIPPQDSKWFWYHSLGSSTYDSSFRLHYIFFAQLHCFDVNSDVPYST